MTKHNIFVLFTALLISAGIWMSASHKKPHHGLVFSSSVFQTNNGWGYSIYANDSIFIKQETIPGLDGNKGFSNKEQAQKAAQLIINKMERGDQPLVTTFELRQLLSGSNVQHEATGTIK